MALGDEIQGVQAEALQALELELAGDLESAAEAYTRATTQLQYLLDVCVPQTQAAGDLTTVCRGLLNGYVCRMEALKARLRQRQQQPGAGSAAAAPDPMTGPSPHWLHVDGAAAAPPYYEVASATSASDGIPLIVDPGDPGGARLIACGAGGAAALDCQGWGPGGGARSGGGGSGGGAEHGAAKVELLRQCQRQVAGTLDDVVGLDSIKDELEEAIFMPLRHPHLFKGIRKPPRHFLLHGPPGTGKTLLVEKMAAEAGFTLLALSPSTILSKWSGESEKAVKLAFDVARAMAPAVVFLDEVDALGRTRATSGDDTASRCLLTELLLQMNGLGADEGVYVFSATNRIADCDAALLRRFDRRIEVPNPDAAARAVFLTGMLSRPEINSQLSLAEIESLAAATEGFSGSDMACLCRHAAMAPVRELLAAARGGERKRRRRLAAAEEDGGGAAGPGGAGSGGEGSGGGGSGGGRGKAELAPVRKLVAGDFEAALRTIRPAAADAATRAG